MWKRPYSWRHNGRTNTVHQVYTLFMYQSTGSRLNYGRLVYNLYPATRPINRVTSDTAGGPTMSSGGEGLCTGYVSFKTPKRMILDCLRELWVKWCSEGWGCIKSWTVIKTERKWCFLPWSYIMGHVYHTHTFSVMSLQCATWIPVILTAWHETQTNNTTLLNHRKKKWESKKIVSAMEGGVMISGPFLSLSY